MDIAAYTIRTLKVRILLCMCPHTTTFVLIKYIYVSLRKRDLPTYVHIMTHNIHICVPKVSEIHIASYTIRMRVGCSSCLIAACMYAYVCMHILMYVGIYVCMYAYTCYACMYIRVHVNAWSSRAASAACMYVCVSVYTQHGRMFMYVCMHIGACMYICIYICIYMHTYICIYICIHKHTYIWVAVPHSSIGQAPGFLRACFAYDIYVYIYIYTSIYMYIYMYIIYI